MAKNIVIIDYTLGNLYSLRRAFQKVGCEPIISGDKKDIINADKVVLPGVGAFSAGMQGLRGKELIETIKKVAHDGKPILGICLGMQMLMTHSEEGGFFDGLDLIKGKVVRFDPPKERGAFKIPHLGWSTVLMPASPEREDTTAWQHTVMDGIGNHAYFYFVHSYYVAPDDPLHAIGITRYGYNTFASVVKKDNITACQFHPEISSDAGLRLINNFVSLKD